VKKRDDLNKRKIPGAPGESMRTAAAVVSAALGAGGSASGDQNAGARQQGRAASWTAGRPILAFALSLVMLATGGCQLFETREAAPLPPEPPPESAQSTPEPVPEADLSTAMAHLEAGKGDAARAVLEELAKDAPGSSVVASLLRQIDTPVEQLLPGPYRQVKVDRGESLSLLAARELGDPLMFYALARLNGIEVPARVPVGALLRVPVNAEAAGHQDEPPSEVTVAELESVAEYLARSGQSDQARAMLIDKLGEGAGAESTHALLASLTLEQAAEMRAEGAFVRAIETIDETLEVLGGSPQHLNLVEEREGLRSELLREEALRLRDDGELVEAYKAAQRAVNLDSDSGEAFVLMEELREELVGTLHNAALIAWRDRNVDIAIRTWESLLAAVPDFEPARIYLERARRLRQRLDEP